MVDKPTFGAVFAASSLLAFAGPAAAVPLPSAQCLTDNAEYWNQADLAGGLTMFEVRDDAGTFIVLAHCAQGQQVSVRPIEDMALSTDDVARSIVIMVASAETFTFNDIRDDFSAPTYQSDITTIWPDGCLCANGN